MDVAFAGHRRPDAATSTFLEAIGIVAHEVLHCALSHQARRQDRDLRRLVDAREQRSRGADNSCEGLLSLPLAASR